MEEDNLKNCPHCGSSMIIYSFDDEGTATDGGRRVRLECVESEMCSANTGWHDSMEEAQAAWNTRTPDPQLAALQWTPIDAENLPKVGDEVLMRFQSALYVREVLSVCGLGKGWTHFRAINAPEKP